MNDDEPKPGVVIDVTPDEEPTADGPAPRSGSDERATEAEPRQKPNRGGLLPLVLALLALVAVGAVGVFAYRFAADLERELSAMDGRLRDALSEQQRLRQTLNQATSALSSQEDTLAEQRQLLAQQREAVDQARSAFEHQEKRLADENIRLEEREAELRAAVADVHRRVGRSGTQWMIAEAEYLLRIANHRLILARDTETARAALELADQRLRDAKDLGWAGVREQIARDVAQLSAFEAPDIAGLSARLSALIEQIPQLKIARATIGPERTLPEKVARDPSERSWETLLDDLWSGFKDSVRIRERDQPVQAMLPPEQQFFLYENLKLHLEAARLGLARGDRELFRSNLRTAGEWIDRYFEAGQGVSVALRQAIDELLETDIRPTLPDISQSLRALQVRQKLMGDVGPTEAASQ